MESRDMFFVEVHSGSGIEVKMQYPLLGMEHAEKRCFMRREVYRRLQKAQELLPDGVYIRVWDAWRPFALQEELYRVYGEQIVEEFGLKDCSAEEQRKVISDYLAVPNPDRKNPPTHTTGGAVDVTLVDAEGKELNMGTEFDSFSEKAHSDYYEQSEGETEEAEPDGEEVRENRRILRKAMLDAGFTGISTEWWHFNYGDRSWAAHTGNLAFYHGVYELSEMIIVEIV